MSSRLILATVAMIFATAPAATAQTRIFDDVEIYPHLPFTNMSMTPISWTHTGIPTASCLSGNRTFILHFGAMTELTGTAGDDYIYIDHILAFAGGQPLLTLEYTFATPIDLTFGGDHDRFRLNFERDGAGDLDMRVDVETLGGTPGVADGPMNMIPADGANDVLFSALGMTAEQWHQVTKVRFHFDAVQNANNRWRLHSIHLAEQIVQMAGGLVAEEWDGTIAPLTPVPPPPYEVEWTWTDPSGGPYEVLHTELSINPASPYPGEVIVSDGTAGAAGGSSVNMTVQADESASPGQFFVGMEFLSNGTLPSLFYPPDPVHFDQKLIVVLMHLKLVAPNAPGFDAGHVYQRIVFEVPEGSNLAFDDLQIDGFEDSNNVFFDLRMDQLPGKRATVTTFTMNVQTNWSPPDLSTAAPEVLPGLDLAAWPSVTSGSTQFRLVNPLDRELRLRIFDARGRWVDELSLPAGSRSVLWSGRDRGGNSLASGRYFAQPLGARGRAIPVTVVR